LTQILSCYFTHTGYVRTNNQDSLLANDVLVSARDMSEPECYRFSGEKQLYLVADGLGGHRGGELASRKVLEVIKKEADRPVVCDKGFVLASMMLAKRSLDQLVREDFGLYGLGTALAGIIIQERHALMFNCGDCRVYRLDANRNIARMTKDHSIVQELVDKGSISEEQMRLHPNKNIVTSTIMGDLFGPAPMINAAEQELHLFERYLVCSDGVWENFDELQIRKILSLQSIEKSAAKLAMEVANKGATDNYSLIVLEISRL
jgi:PPM family protein phosphatase